MPLQQYFSYTVQTTSMQKLQAQKNMDTDPYFNISATLAT
jgi:hypothetical protein